MTDALNPHQSEMLEHDVSHEGPIKTPRQLVLAVLWAHIVPIAGILLLVAYVTSHDRPAAGSEGLTAAAIAQRIQPIGRVEVRDATDTASLKTGEQVFAAQCTACHTAGVAGAPKIGDAAAWAPRIATGYEALLNSALHGKGAMTPQGGGDFSDLEIGRAVVYMANKAGAKFEEPKAPAVAPASATAKADAGADAAAAAAASSAQAAMAAVAATKTAAAPTAGAQAGAQAGAAPALYTQVCAACHATGVAGAPKFGDKAAWAPRLAQGIDGLTASAIHGKNAMPPKGGAATASDADIKAVVTYMANAAK